MNHLVQVFFKVSFLEFVDASVMCIAKLSLAPTPALADVELVFNFH